jgi:16S rRNA (uracil1498-N3)-methyltransferase
MINEHDTAIEYVMRLVDLYPNDSSVCNEISESLKAGFIPVTLGNNRLRTETAAIVACHSVAFFNED